MCTLRRSVSSRQGELTDKASPCFLFCRTSLGWGVSVIPTKMFLRTRKMPAVEKYMLDRRYPPSIDGMLYFSHINDPASAPLKSRPDAKDITAEDDSGTDSDPVVARAGHPLYSHDSSSESDDYGNEDEGDANLEGSTESRMDHGLDRHRRQDSTASSWSTTSTGSTWSTVSTDSGLFTYDPSTMSRNWDVLLKRNYQFHLPDVGSDVKNHASSPFQLSMIICPSIGLTWPNLNLQGLIRTLQNSKHRSDHSQEDNLYKSQKKPSAEVADMARRFFFLRTYSTTVEIASPDWSVVPFYIARVLKPPTQLPFLLWDMERDFHRCSLIHCIPEINLIVVGNMFGRVVLLRPLKNSRPHLSPDAPEWAFRAEWTLPLARDEREKRRPPCCLLGMAVSPLPEPCAGRYGMVSRKKHPRPARTRRWRLILHYMDHTILQYYIEGSESGESKVSRAVF